MLSFFFIESLYLLIIFSCQCVFIKTKVLTCLQFLDGSWQNKDYDLVKETIKADVTKSYKNYLREGIPSYTFSMEAEETRTSGLISGLSMGGGQACVISANYPDMFGYIGLFSAAVSAYDKGTSEMTMNFDEKLAKLFSFNPMYWIAIGDEDFLYQANKSFREKLDSAGYKYIYTESDCGHVWKNWRHYLTAFSQLLFK